MFNFLAIEFEKVQVQLDLSLRALQVSNDSNSATAKSDGSNSSTAKELQSITQRLELWSNDISVRTPITICSAAEILQSMEDFESEVVKPLRSVFRPMLQSAHGCAVAASK